MPQQIIPATGKQIWSALAHWNILPAMLGLMSVAKLALSGRTELVQQQGGAGQKMPVSGWARTRAQGYLGKLNQAWETVDFVQIEALGLALKACWKEGRQVFVCGNGGSAANAVHLANDLLYGIDKPAGRGMRVVALPANAAVLTCLGNDTGYAEIYSRQLVALGRPGDLLIVFSGSGNSANILKALREARLIGMTSFAVLGYNGGQSRGLADHVIHFSVDDMQVSEDLQMMVGHMLAQWLLENREQPPKGNIHCL